MILGQNNWLHQSVEQGMVTPRWVYSILGDLIVDVCMEPVHSNRKEYIFVAPDNGNESIKRGAENVSKRT